MRLWHFDDRDAVGVDDAGVGVGEDVEPAAPGAHFFEIGAHFRHQFAAGRHRHHRHVFVHQRQRPMLQFAGGIAFGVDVGDFLELERAFQGDWIVNAAA